MAHAQTYSSNPAINTFKNVGNGYQMRVSSISGSTVTFEIYPKTGTFGSAATPVIRTGSVNGLTVATGSTYSVGASCAGTVAVNMQAANLSPCIGTPTASTDYKLMIYANSASTISGPSKPFCQPASHQP